jgi:hypothetical protein
VLVTKMAALAAPRIRSVAPDVSAPFARVIDRALEFRREDRYESAAAMRADVCAAIAKLDAGVEATQIALPSTVVTTINPRPSAFEPTQPSGAPPPASSTPANGKPARPRGARSLLGLLVVFLAGSVVAKLWFDALGVHAAGRAAAADAADAARAGEPGGQQVAQGEAGPVDASSVDAPPIDEASADLAANPAILTPAAPDSAVRDGGNGSPPRRLPPAGRASPGKRHKLPAVHHANRSGASLRQ